MIVDGKAAGGVHPRHGQGERTRSVPMTGVGIRQFPAGMPEAARATPGIPGQLPVTLKCHLGDTRDFTRSGLQELSWKRKTGLKAAHILSRNLQG